MGFGLSGVMPSGVLSVYRVSQTKFLKDLYLLSVTRKVMEQILAHQCLLNDCFKLYVSINNLF